MAARMPDASRSYTPDQFRSLPPSDVFLYELSGGLLVREPRPGAAHGFTVARLCHLLVSYARDHGGHVTTETGFVLSEEPATIRGPDVAWLASAPQPYGDPEGFIRGAPDLAIEVVSPSNAATEIQEKVLEYFAAGASQVWVVYPRTRSMVIHGSPSEARALREGGVIEGGALLPGLSIEVASIFG